MSADGGVLAVCVNWNGRGVLGDTLAALAANDYGRLRIWVVDNASLDGSLEEVPPQIRCFFRQVLLSYAPFSTQTGQT